MGLYNVVEPIVRRAVEQSMETMDCCRCEQCKLDSCAVALNQLKPHYVVSTLGEALTVNMYLNSQKQAEIYAEAYKAIRFVSANPRHNASDAGKDE